MDMNLNYNLSDNLSRDESSLHQAKYQCPEASCGKFFKTKSCFEIHMKAHNGDQPFQCLFENCGKSFAQYTTLQNHKKSHTKEKTLFKCDQCESTFAVQACLIRHKLIHTGERPFVCEICMRTFSTKSNLKQHQQIHKDADARPKFECNRCGKSYQYQNSLNKHMKHHAKEDAAGTLHASTSDGKESQTTKIDEEDTSQSLKVESYGDLLKNHKKVKKAESEPVPLGPAMVTPVGPLGVPMNLIELAIINEYLLRTAMAGTCLTYKSGHSLLHKLVGGGNFSEEESPVSEGSESIEQTFRKGRTGKDNEVLNVLQRDFFGESSNI